MLATGGYDGLVKLWRAATEQEAMCFFLPNIGQR